MNFRKRAMLLAASVVVCGAHGFAQTAPSIPQSPPATIEGKFVIARFEAEDRTVVALAHQKVGGDAACGLYITAGYTYVGKSAKAPKRVWISIVRNTTDEPKLLKTSEDRKLTMNVDGEDLDLGEMASVKETIIGYSLTHQGLVSGLAFQTFMRIVNAKKVEAKIGFIKFKLTDENLQDFRDLAKRINP